MIGRENDMSFRRRGAKTQRYDRRKSIRYLLCVLCVSASNNHITLSTAQAGGWELGGHIKYQYTHADYRADDLNAVLGADPADDHDLDLRLKAERRAGPWDFAAHYELLGLAGDTLEARRRSAALGLSGAGTVTGLPDDRRRLFDLTGELADGDRSAAVQRLDRLSAGYSTGRQTVRFGRQVISWGNGLVFHPLDFVNPFSPIAIDKDYKTGDDMLYGQWLAGVQGDVQAVIVPRRDSATREVKARQSTYAVKSRSRFNGLDLDLILARHYDENLAGFGLVRSVGGAVWRMDVGYAAIEDGSSAVSLATNVDYSWISGGKNVYGYAEYFRNGFGERDRARYAAPDPALAARLARGELYTLARDYAALGLQIEAAPLLNFHTNLIWNLNDASRFLQLRGVYDWRQNTELSAGVNWPAGARGDEYGGIPVGSTNTFTAPARSLYVRLAQYF